MAKKTTKLSGEAHTRTIVKAISWRVIATITTMTIVFLFTREIILSLGVGLAEVIVRRELEPEDMEIIKNKLKELGYID